MAGPLTTSQRTFLAYSRTVSASLSVIASSILVYKMVIRSIAHTKTGSSATKITCYHRILFGMSVVDIMSSIWQALNTLAVPASTGVVGARGTIGTCSAQGFFVQLSTASPVYAAMLSVYFMLKIRYDVKDHEMSKRYEVFFHAIPLLMAFSTASIGVALKLFNPIGLPEMGCWIAHCNAYYDCSRSYKIVENVNLYAWTFSYMWLFISAFVVLISNSLIYMTIRAHESKNANYGATQILANSWQSTQNQTTGESNTSFNLNQDLSGSQLSTPSKHNLPKDDVEPKEVVGHENPVSVEEGGVREDAPPSTKTRETVPSGTTLPEGENVLPARKLSSSNSFSLSAVFGRNSFTGSGCTMARPSQTVARLKITKQAATQSLLYVATALFTTIWVFLPWLGKKLEVELQWRYFLAFMVNIVNPAQGLFNLLIFIRLQYLRLRDTKSWSRWQCLKVCLFSPDSK